MAVAQAEVWEACFRAQRRELQHVLSERTREAIDLAIDFGVALVRGAEADDPGQGMRDVVCEFGDAIAGGKLLLGLRVPKGASCSVRREVHDRRQKAHGALAKILLELEVDIPPRRRKGRPPPPLPC